MDKKQYVNIRATKRGRQLLRLIAALKGQSMQDAAEAVFVEEIKRLREEAGEDGKNEREK